MKLVERPLTIISGWPVMGPFEQLSTLVPNAWKRFLETQPGIAVPAEGYAEISTHLGDGVYHEVVGILHADSETSHPEGPVTMTMPTGRYVFARHDGRVEDIGHTFGAMQKWASSRELTVGHHKLDVGYRLSNGPEKHDLYLQLVDPAEISPNAR
ncbi:effector binding domain-containing protein [Rhodococcus sp. ARC_M6]|uniref:effector binding domain-containing protein n=1 Tax=Rhodococcus sp. ARC_M6 TaxID=2928852 RepID=UPI001FB50104|nr:hypothetical protein [Rhodococcus sp. ARC_M6]MCJ0907353.1 hypothetical protein [Rhodococcus sp. ARC_M6]